VTARIVLSYGDGESPDPTAAELVEHLPPAVLIEAARLLRVAGPWEDHPDQGRSRPALWDGSVLAGGECPEPDLDDLPVGAVYALTDEYGGGWYAQVHGVELLDADEAGVVFASQQEAEDAVDGDLVGAGWTLMSRPEVTRG